MKRSKVSFKSYKYNNFKLNFMAENDEYYGSGKAREAYDGLREAYETVGWSAEQIDEILIIFQRILLYITKKYIM